MYIDFQQNQVCISVKTMNTNLFAKIARCINLQLPIVIIKKMTLSDIHVGLHHRKTYMYINFQQNRAHKSICKKMQIA